MTSESNIEPASNFGDPRTIVVTGAGGQLGRDVVRSAAAAGHAVDGFGHAALDITDADQCARIITTCSPDVVIHCAAYTAVDDAESDPATAFAVNERGTEHVARAAAACGAQLVVVSTDYVFPGTNPDGYAEDDAVDPINVYGQSKLAAEHAAMAHHPAPCIARTAWLFGETGTNFVRTIAALSATRPALDVVTDQCGSPTWTQHLADALVACAQRNLTGIVHLAGSPPATWFTVAEEVVRVAGTECEIRPTTSAAFPRPAPRPACSILRATRPDTPTVGDWRLGVAAVLRDGVPA